MDKPNRAERRKNRFGGGRATEHAGWPTHQPNPVFTGDTPAAEADPTDDAWRELLSLIATIEPTELIDPRVGTERLLYRLFHAHGVRVFEGVTVVDECSCSRDKVRGILKGFSAEEIEDSIEHGQIKVSCEFCSKAYEFDPAEFKPAN